MRNRLNTGEIVLRTVTRNTQRGQILVKLEREQFAENGELTRVRFWRLMSMEAYKRLRADGAAET